MSTVGVTSDICQNPHNCARNQTTDDRTKSQHNHHRRPPLLLQLLRLLRLLSQHNCHATTTTLSMVDQSVHRDKEPR